MILVQNIILAPGFKTCKNKNLFQGPFKFFTKTLPTMGKHNQIKQLKTLYQNKNSFREQKIKKKKKKEKPINFQITNLGALTLLRIKIST